MGQFPISSVPAFNLLCGLSDFCAMQQGGQQLHLPAADNTSARCPSMASVSTVRSLIEKAKTQDDMAVFPHILHKRARVLY